MQIRNLFDPGSGVEKFGSGIKKTGSATLILGMQTYAKLHNCMKDCQAYPT
jgi:hypothetical protein